MIQFTKQYKYIKICSLMNFELTRAYYYADIEWLLGFVKTRKHEFTPTKLGNTNLSRLSGFNK